MKGFEKIVATFCAEQIGKEIKPADAEIILTQILQKPEEEILKKGKPLLKIPLGVEQKLLLSYLYVHKARGGGDLEVEWIKQLLKSFNLDSFPDKIKEKESLASCYVLEQGQPSLFVWEGFSEIGMIKEMLQELF